MWNELVTTALIGTERRQLNLDNPPDGLRELAAQLADESAERQLLALASAAALYQRVGASTPTDDTPLLDPCDLDDLPPCSPRAGLLLQQIIAISNQSMHLNEWLLAAAQAGQRISDEYLPRILIQIEGRQNFAEMIYEILGKRGRWLAQQNPNWAYAVLPETDDEWLVASRAGRLYYLRQLRTDDPAHSRALLESVWQSEKAEDRTLFVQTLGVGLSLADEPFLEAALDDRSANVRAADVRLLATLPGSAFSQRMIARAESLIKIDWRKQLVGKKLIIEVTLPEVIDASMQRDGIPEDAPPDSKMGVGAHRLSAIAAALPSAYWLSGDWSARDLVEAASEHQDWSKLLLSVLARAAEREQHDALASALLQAELDPSEEVLALRGACPETREAHVLRALAKETDAANPEGTAFKTVKSLCNAEHHWSHNFTQAFIKAVEQILPKLSTVGVTGLIIQLPHYVLWMHPACADELQALVSIDNKNKPTWKIHMKRAAQTLEFRQKIHKEFAR